MSPERNRDREGSVIRVEGRGAGTALTSVRPPATSESRSRGWRRRALLAVLIALVVAVVTLVVVRPRSEQLHVTAYHGPLPHFTITRTYHVTYRVTAPHGPSSTQELFVRRPFESVEEQSRD